MDIRKSAIAVLALLAMASQAVSGCPIIQAAAASETTPRTCPMGMTGRCCKHAGHKSTRNEKQPDCPLCYNNAALAKATTVAALPLSQEAVLQTKPRLELRRQ